MSLWDGQDLENCRWHAPNPEMHGPRDDRDFYALLEILERFKIFAKHVSEHELENKLFTYLQTKEIAVERQKATTNGRYDVVVKVAGKRFIIELKNIAGRDCVEQLDRYSRDCNGLILLCWKASQPLRIVVELGKGRARIPLALVEVRQNCNIW